MLLADLLNYIQINIAKYVLVYTVVKNEESQHGDSGGI